MRIVTESDQCVCPKSDEEAVNTRVPVLNFSLEGKSIYLEPRVREDSNKKNQKSTSPQHLRIDLQREQGIQLPKKPGRIRKSKALQRRLSEQRKSVREVVLTRRPSAAPRALIPPRTPLVMSKMSMPSEGQKFSDNDNSVAVNTSEDASNVVKRLMGTNSVVEESTSTKKVSKQVAVRGNVNAIRGQVLQQQGSLDNVQESNNNRALSEINSNNQVVNTSQKTVSSTSSSVSTKTTRRESYSTQTQVQESMSSSYEDAEDNSGVAAISSPDQIKAATNVSKTSKTSKQVKEVRQSTLQSTSSIDSDISSVDEGVKKVKKDQQSTVQTVDTQVQKTKDTEKIVAENADYTEQTKTMSVEEFQKIRTIKEFIHIQKKLKNAEDNDTEEEEEEDYESEKIMSVDDIRKRLATNPPKEVINDATKTEQIIKGSRIEEIRTTTKTIFPNPDNGDQPVEQETVTIERKVVPAGTTIMSDTENTEKTKKQVVATQETAVKKTTTTESQQVKQTKTKTTETGNQQVVKHDTTEQNVQNTENISKQNVQNVQAVQTENVQQNVQTQNVQQVQQTAQKEDTQTIQQNVQTQNVQQNVQTQNVHQVQQNVQTQNVQQVQQNVQTQNIQQNVQTQNVQEVQKNIQDVQTQNVQQNTQDSQQTKTTEQTATQNNDQTQQTKSMTLEEFQNIRKIKEYITTERKKLNPVDNFVEEEGETSFEAEIILTLDEIRKRIATQPPKETVKDTTKDAPIPPGYKILEIRTITRTVLPNPDKNDEKVEQVTVLLERTVVPADTPLIPDSANTPQKQVVTAGQETAVKKTTNTTESQQVQQTKTQVTQTGTTDTQNVAQNKNVQTSTQNIQDTQNVTQNKNVQTSTQNVQDTQNVTQNKNVQTSTQNVQDTQNVAQNKNVQTSTQNVQDTQTVQNIQKTQNLQTTQNVQETQNVQRNIQETQSAQRNVQESQNIQNEALKSSVNTIKKTTLTSTSSIDSDTSSLDEASRLNQNNQLIDANQVVGGSSVVKQTSSKTTKVTETRKIIKQSSTGAPETHVEEASKTQSSETVVNATCGSDGKFNVEENTKSSTTVSSGIGNEEEMKRQIQSQNKNLTKKLVSDGVTVVADVDQLREKVVQQQEGDSVTYKQTTTDSKHKRMVEDASKFEQPALALAALPSPDSQPGSASPQIEMPSFQPNK